MDPRLNPYTPNAGARPPALVGRDAELRAFEILLERLARGYTEQSLIVTGLRGVGKTVLLDEFRDLAAKAGWTSVEAEVVKNLDFPAKMSHLVRRALLQLAPRERWQERAKNAAATLKSFTVTVKPDGTLSAGLGVEAAAGFADSGELGDDLSDLLVALGEAALEAGTGVVFLLDEVQFLEPSDFEALIAALHRTVRRSLPVTLVAAGLPQMPRLAAEAKSYSERLFRFPRIGELPADAAAEALRAPARALDVVFAPDAVASIVDYTQGYPYFLQEYGKVLWDQAASSRVGLDDVRAARPLVEARLDESFFRVRAERTTPLELQYLRSMAELGPGPQRAKDVAAVLGKKAEQLGPIRARLVEKGLLYTPSYGLAAFTVPQFDRYLKRTYEIVDL